MAPISKRKAVSRVKPSSRLRAKSSAIIRRPATANGKQLRQLDASSARPHLLGLHRHTKGEAFRVQAFRTWLQQRIVSKGFRLPSVLEAQKLLASLVRADRSVWAPQGVSWTDAEGSGSVDNVQGFEQGPPSNAGRWVAWNECGFAYRLRKDSKQRDCYQVVRTKAFKRLSCTVARRTLAVQTESGEAQFKQSVVFDPRRLGAGPAPPPWSLIYLHSFSGQGTNYQDFPHYFGVSSAPVRVLLPTAPLQEQTCFDEWFVYRGKRLKWRPIQFNSWFDYRTDKGGTGENQMTLESLLEMRARIHALIRQEVRRVGDPRRVIVGGASQGCCVALDAALTYPDMLAGVIGVVGHVLGLTPLDPAKRQLPIHLFHEANDREMQWKWIQPTVQRLVDAGFNVKSQREADPANCGHWVQDIEGQWIRSALRKIINREGGI